MKISWGTGIAIFYSFFVIAMLVFVYAATNQDISLVSDTYYEEDLSYQVKLDKIQRTNQLKHIFELSIEQNSTCISVTIPEELSHFKGNMTLFHPAYASLDQAYPIENNAQHKQIIPVEKLKKGRWLVKIEGESEGKNYYHEAYLLAP
jgi:hypothetical protein